MQSISIITSVHSQSQILSQESNSKYENESGNVVCDFCGNIIEACMCVCPYCGIRDKCECCLHDAATGG